MTFRQFQLVVHTPTGRTGRIIQAGDGDYALVNFNYGGEELVEQEELRRQSDTTVKMMTRGALGDYHRKKIGDDVILTDAVLNRYIERLVTRHQRAEFFRNHILYSDSTEEE